MDFTQCAHFNRQFPKTHLLIIVQMHAFSVNDTGDDVDREKTPKSLFTHTQLPAYVDPNQIPVRRRPFSTIVSNSIVSGVCNLSI